MQMQKDTWLDLPQKLTKENRWTLWRLSKQVTAKGRPSIELLQAASPDQTANVEDPYSWASFTQAHATLLRGKGQGLAYINSRYTPIVTITFYNAVDNGKIASWALRYFDTLNAYAEEGIVPGSLVLLYEGGSEKPLTWGNVAVRRNPFIALTGKRLPGAPERVGTSPGRLQTFINESRRDFERLIKRRGSDPVSHMAGKNLERLLGSLQGVRKTGPNRWVAASPVSKADAALSIRLDQGRILLYDYSGASIKDINDALGIGFDLLVLDETPPELPGSTTQLLSRPLEGEMLEKVQKSQHRLRSMGKLPKAFEGLTLDLRDALEAGLGAASNEDGVVIFSDLDSRPLSASIWRGSANGQASQYTLTPGYSATSWLSPRLSQTQNGILVVQGILNAVQLWSLVRQDGLGVIGIVDARGEPHGDTVRRLSLQTVYLYADSQDKRNDVLERWAALFRQQGFPVVLLPELVPGSRVDMVEFVYNQGPQKLLERLVEMGVGG